MADEKRQSSRLFAVADVTFGHNGVVLHGRISDISLGGFYIDTINPLLEGSTISFQFSLPDDEVGSPISGEGRVVWNAHMQGMGIAFTLLSEEDKNRIKAYLSRR